jgi:hypothetical protein
MFPRITYVTMVAIQPDCPQAALGLQRCIDYLAAIEVRSLFFIFASQRLTLYSAAYVAGCWKTARIVKRV